MKSRFLIPALLAAVLFVYLAGALVFAQTRSVWSPDCGARLIQVESVLANFPRFDVAYPAQSLDLDNKNSPLSFFAYPHNGKTYIFYSFLFALGVAPLYKAFGFFGLALPAVLGGWAAVGLTYFLAKRLSLRAPLVPALLTGLVTPLFLYSIVFWDHALLTAIGLGALLLFLRGVETNRFPLFLAAGACIGAGVWLHEILLPFVPALVAASFAARAKVNPLRASALVILGAILPIIPLAFVNQSLYGTPLGPHLSNNRLGSGDSITQFLLTPQEWIPGALYTLIGWGDANPGFTPQLRLWLEKPWPKFRQEIAASLWMAAPMLVWACLALGGLLRKAWPLALLTLGGLMACAVWVIANPEFPHGIFVACPVLALAFAAPMGTRAAVPSPGTENRRIVAVFALVYTLANLLKPTLGGTEWGSRHLLGILPCLMLLAWCAAESWHAQIATETSPRPRLFLSASAMLALLSLLVTLHGMSVVHGMHVRNRALADAIIAAEDDTIITTAWWTMPNAAPAYLTKRVLYAGDVDHPAQPVFARLRLARVPTVTVIGYSVDDLSYFARQSVYVPISGTDTSLPMNLFSRRYLRIAPP